MSIASVLIVSSEEKLSALIKSVLESNRYDVVVAYTGKSASELFSTRKFDLVYLDMGLRDIDPLYLLRDFKQKDADVVVLALVLPNSAQLNRETMSQGVFDHMTKPPQLDEISLKAQRALSHRRFLLTNRNALKGLEEKNLALQKYSNTLAKRIDEKARHLMDLYKDLNETYLRTITALAQAIDARDHYTRSHSENVTKYAEKMAEEMKLDTEKIEEISNACRLHDLGKIGVHDAVLLKPGKLTPEEFEEIKSHAMKGAQILESLTFLENVMKIVKQHHERYDGKGYPFGLKGEEIDLGARIMAVADAYESMVSARPYRTTPLSKEAATAEIKRCSGSQFDPKIVEVFLRVVDKFV